MLHNDHQLGHQEERIGEEGNGQEYCGLITMAVYSERITIAEASHMCEPHLHGTERALLRLRWHQ